MLRAQHTDAVAPDPQQVDTGREELAPQALQSMPGGVADHHARCDADGEASQALALQAPQCAPGGVADHHAHIDADGEAPQAPNSAQGFSSDQQSNHSVPDAEAPQPGQETVRSAAFVVHERKAMLED